MKIEIEVTQAHIEAGLPCAANHCAIALAMKEVFPYVMVTGRDIHLDTSQDSSLMVDVPLEVNRFITAFDSGLGVAPFKFKLEIPDEVIQVIRLPNLESLLNEAQHLHLVS